jgi:hypothetical protein
MSRFLPLLALALPSLPSATALQNPTIPWSLQVEQAVARARQEQRPLMFWVLGGSRNRNDRIERDQKRAFADPLVRELAGRFVPVRLSRSRYRDLLEKWRLSPRTNLEIVFVTPDGERIDTLAPGGVADPEIFARKMTLVFRHYRGQMFAREIKPKLEDDATSEKELRAALGRIAEFLILSADKSVIDLFERRALGAETRKQAYDTLAALSTSASVEFLLGLAVEDERAAAALQRCTPDGAEQMLTKLGGDDPELHLAVYRAVTRICKLRDVKRDRFWQGRIASLKRKETERVSRLVAATAKRWRERYADYR